MSASKRDTGSNLAKVDAQVVQPDEYDELPEWTEETFARADLVIGGRVVRRGRPKAATTKIPVTLRLDPDVLAAFRAGGAGWQTRMNDALRQAIGPSGRGRGQRIQKNAPGVSKPKADEPAPTRKPKKAR